jgi:hypothetical protein
MHADVPRQINRMDAGIFFIKPVFSKQASAPTKLAEFLGCGVPCLANAGVGDMTDLLEGEAVGVALRSFSEDALLNGLHALLGLTSDPNTRIRCIVAARQHFALEEGVRRYSGVYSQLSGAI